MWCRRDWRARPGKIAGVPEYAAVEFEAITPDVVQQLTDGKRWAEIAQAARLSLNIAALVLADDHLAAAERWGKADEEATETAVKCLSGSTETLRALIKLLTTAELRILAGVSRHLVAAGEA